MNQSEPHTERRMFSRQLVVTGLRHVAWQRVFGENRELSRTPVLEID